MIGMLYLKLSNPGINPKNGKNGDYISNEDLLCILKASLRDNPNADNPNATFLINFFFGLKFENEELKKEIEKLLQQKHASEKKSFDLFTDQQILKKTQESHEKVFKEFDQKILLLEKEKEKLEKELLLTKEHLIFQDDTTDLEKKIEKKNKKIDNLKNQIVALNFQIGFLNSRITELQKENKKLQKIDKKEEEEVKENKSESTEYDITKKIKDRINRFVRKQCEFCYNLMKELPASNNEEKEKKVLNIINSKGLLTEYSKNPDYGLLIRKFQKREKRLKDLIKENMKEYRIVERKIYEEGFTSIDNKERNNKERKDILNKEYRRFVFVLFKNFAERIKKEEKI